MLAFLASLVLPILTLAADPVTVVHKIAPGRQLYVEIAKPAPGKPTFLFLPGVNRGVLMKEPALQELLRSGNGVVTFHFSVQPFSLATLKAGEKPAFYAADPSLADLAAETASLAAGVRREFGVGEVIPVTLSYSGAVSPSLRGFPRVVDAVPLTSMAAFNPELNAYRNWLKSGELFNPIFGPGITRASLDQAYRYQWVKQVDGIVEQFSLPKDRKNEMVDGYVRLSRATEGFEWSFDRADKTARTFVLAADEKGALLRSQLSLARDRLAAGAEDSVFIVQESGHIVPSDQPAAYARILEAVATGRAQGGVTVVRPSTGEWKYRAGREAITFLEQAIKGLPVLKEDKRERAPEGRDVPGAI